MNELRERLSNEKSELEEAIFARAEQKSETYEARYTRPAIDRRGTEETFAPVEARYVRLIVEGRETDPYARSGHHIDEFEVWTAEERARNVALSSSGGRAAGSSRIAEDFADAYSPDLTIDGRFGARWIAAGPELTVTLAQPEPIDRIFFSSDRTGAAGDHPVAAFERVPHRGLVRRRELDRGRQLIRPPADFPRAPPQAIHRGRDGLGGVSEIHRFTRPVRRSPCSHRRI